MLEPIQGTNQMSPAVDKRGRQPFLWLLRVGLCNPPVAPICPLGDSKTHPVPPAIQPFVLLVPWSELPCQPLPQLPGAPNSSWRAQRYTGKPAPCWPQPRSGPAELGIKLSSLCRPYSVLGHGHSCPGSVLASLVPAMLIGPSSRPLSALPLPTGSQVGFCSFSPVLVATASTGATTYQSTDQNVPPARPQPRPQIPLPAGLIREGLWSCPWGKHSSAGERRTACTGLREGAGVPRSPPKRRTRLGQGTCGCHTSKAHCAWAGSFAKAGAIATKGRGGTRLEMNGTSYVIPLSLGFSICKMGVIIKPNSWGT